MKQYTRAYPVFSLCGLNCGLCPRYHTNGASRCPGCGGEGFSLLHPSCAVITCSRKHGNVEFCFDCECFPCEKYRSTSDKDSFITYCNVLSDMESAKENGITNYISVLNQKIAFLEYLLLNFDDGRRKGLFCTAVNLFSLDDIERLKEALSKIDAQATLPAKARSAADLIYAVAKEKGINLNLRK